jgi:chromosome segregation protein
MRLKKLEISGFKSFVDKAAIHFPPGISAVVGPNGCGKSNILDALRWVMGEQSVKQLRGKSMEDIIFAGASGRPPLNLAEVNLTLVNDNGSAPEEWRDYSEIMITRRLFRSGESGYLINKQPCRLKDILNIFLGSGLGAKSYAIIQQGNIGAITDAGPEERRFFIEEAAGVTRFKQRRNETLRKLDATQQNLYRLSDIIAELKRQMAGLKRQARKAELYKSYQERIKVLDVRLADHRFADLTGRLERSRGLLQELKAADIGHATEIKRIDAAVEEIKLRRMEKNQEIAEQKNHHFDTRRTVDRLETDIAHMKTDIERLDHEARELEGARGDLADKNQRIDRDIDETREQRDAVERQLRSVRETLQREKEVARESSVRHAEAAGQLDQDKNRLMELVAQEARYTNIHQNAQNNKESLQRRLRRIDEEALQAAAAVAREEEAERRHNEALAVLRREADQFGRRIREVKERIETHNARLAAQVKATHGLELERGRLRSQFQALKKLEDSLEGFRDGVKAVMKASSRDGSGLTGVVGLLADAVVPEPGFEAAAEAALGEALQFVLVDTPEAGLRAMDFLRESAAGRSGFVPLSAVRPLPSAGDPAPPAGTVPLLDRLAVHADLRGAAEALLGHVAVADTAEEAVRLSGTGATPWTIVTTGGDVVTHQGLMSGGGKDKWSGILEKKQEIKALDRQLEELDRKVRAAREAQERQEKEARQLDIDLHRLVEEKNAVDEDLMEGERQSIRTTEALRNARRHQEIVSLEQEQLLGEESDIDAEIDRHAELLGQVTAEVRAAQERVSGIGVRVAELAEAVEASSRRVTDIQLEATALSARLDSHNDTLRRLEDFRTDGNQRLADLLEQIESKRNRAEALRAKVRGEEQRLAAGYTDLERLGETLEASESEYRDIDERLRESDSRIEALQDQREKTLEQIRLLELEASELQLKRENVANRILERYQAPLPQLRAELSAEADGLDLPVEGLEKELERARKKIDAIQDVNLGAIREYEQLKTRFDFLCEQRDDLNQAIEDLHKVIRKINRITQERFLDTLGKVNEKLVEVFPKLFQGGSATLAMTNPNDPLETGVEYLIHPPGKKLTRMSLLSGGEKALSAIAFIFSIFLIRPTSFCLLDEIDAPLDDANVGRFNELLRSIGEKSQIIMITHNKRSMEFADTLFGITMEKKGISKVVSVDMEKPAQPSAA